MLVFLRETIWLTECGFRKITLVDNFVILQCLCAAERF